MSYLILGVNNLVDRLTLTHSNGIAFNSLYPLDNLKNPVLEKVARTTTDTSFTLSGNLPYLTSSEASWRNVGCICLANHNLTRYAKIQIKTYFYTTENEPVDLTSSLNHDSGDLAVYPYFSQGDAYWDNTTYTDLIVYDEYIEGYCKNFIYLLPETVRFRKIEIIITDADSNNQHTYFEFGRLFVGDIIEPYRNAEHGDFNYTNKDLSKINITENGVKYTKPYPVIRSINCSWKLLSESERERVFHTQINCGLRGEVVVCYGRPEYKTIDSKKAVSLTWWRQSFLGNFAQLDPLSQPYALFHAAAVNVEEVAR